MTPTEKQTLEIKIEAVETLAATYLLGSFDSRISAKESDYRMRVATDLAGIVADLEKVCQKL